MNGSKTVVFSKIVNVATVKLKCLVEHSHESSAVCAAIFVICDTFMKAA